MFDCEFTVVLFLLKPNCSWHYQKLHNYTIDLIKAKKKDMKYYSLPLVQAISLQAYYQT